jgi:hypothetical protein
MDVVKSCERRIQMSGDTSCGEDCKWEAGLRFYSWYIFAPESMLMHILLSSAFRPGLESDRWCIGSETQQLLRHVDQLPVRWPLAESGARVSGRLFKLVPRLVADRERAGSRIDLIVVHAD